MKWGLRRPSLNKRIAARLSLKRFVRHSLGVKAPRGWGWLTNPRKALYNRVYRRTTFGIEDLFRQKATPGVACGCMAIALIAVCGVLMLGLALALVARPASGQSSTTRPSANLPRG